MAVTPGCPPCCCSPGSQILHPGSRCPCPLLQGEMGCSAVTGDEQTVRATSHAAGAAAPAESIPAGWEGKTEHFHTLLSLAVCACAALFSSTSYPTRSKTTGQERSTAGFKPESLYKKSLYSKNPAPGANDCMKSEINTIKEVVAVMYPSQKSPDYPSIALEMLFICIHTTTNCLQSALQN